MGKSLAPIGETAEYPVTEALHQRVYFEVAILPRSEKDHPSPPFIL